MILFYKAKLLIYIALLLYHLSVTQDQVKTLQTNNPVHSKYVNVDSFHLLHHSGTKNDVNSAGHAILWTVVNANLWKGKILVDLTSSSNVESTDGALTIMFSINVDRLPPPTVSEVKVTINILS